MIESASGVFAAAAKSAASPTPAASPIGIPSARPRALPSAAPTKKSGVTSPPEEARGQRHRGEDELEREGVERQRGIGEGAEDHRHAEPEVVAGAHEPPQRDDHDPSQRHPQRHAEHAPLEELLQPVGELDEGDARQRDREREDGPLAEQERRETQRGGRGVRGVGDAERARHPIADEGRDQRGKERVVLHAPDADDLEPEDRAGDRRAEDRPKPPAIPAARGAGASPSAPSSGAK